MTIKTIIKLFSLALCGCLGGLLLIEAGAHLVKGSPLAAMSGTASYYDSYEFYRKFFKKTVDKNNTAVYVSQRTRSAHIEFPVHKGSLTKRIFIVGESTAGTFARSIDQFRDILRQFAPRYQYEIIDCSRGAYDSTRILPVVREIVHYDPDLILVFMGNNLWINYTIDPLLFNDAFRALYEHSWIVKIAYDKYKGSNQYTIRQDMHEKTRTFAANYQSIISSAREHGIPVAVFKLPANECYQPVSVSPYTAKTESLFRLRLALEKNDIAGARDLLAFLRQDDGLRSDPLVSFLSGKLNFQTGNFDKAREDYRKAVVLDGVPGSRCDRMRNRMIDRLGKMNDCIVVDIEKLFTDMAEHRIVGDEFFDDNCHWLTCFNTLIIHELIEQVNRYNSSHAKKAIVRDEEQTTPLPVPDRERLKQEARNSIAMSGSGYLRGGISLALMTGGRNIEESIYFFSRVYRIAPALLFSVSSVSRKDEFREVARQNEYIGPLNQRIDTQWYSVLLCAGETLRRMGDDRRALELFKQSLECNPGQWEAYLYRGIMRYQQKNYEAARKDWLQVIQRNKDYQWLLGLLSSDGGTT